MSFPLASSARRSRSFCAGGFGLTDAAFMPLKRRNVRRHLQVSNYRRNRLSSFDIACLASRSNLVHKKRRSLLAPSSTAWRSTRFHPVTNVDFGIRASNWRAAIASLKFRPFQVRVLCSWSVLAVVELRPRDFAGAIQSPPPGGLDADFGRTETLDLRPVSSGRCRRNKPRMGWLPSAMRCGY